MKLAEIHLSLQHSLIKHSNTLKPAIKLAAMADAAVVNPVNSSECTLQKHVTRSRTTKCALGFIMHTPCC